MTSMDSMRICILSKMFPPGVGGAETYAYELANGLGKRGHDVDVYTQWVEEPEETVDVHDNVSIYRICKAQRKFVTFETIRFSIVSRKAIDFDKYDIVHGTLMPASTIAVTPLNDCNPPVVVTSHGTSIDEAKAVSLETPADYLLKFFFHPMNVLMDYLASRDTDRVIAISDDAHEQLTTFYRLPTSVVEMIPHGVDTDWFYPRDERHPSVDPDKTTLLYVGRLGARKGLDLAIRGLAATGDTQIEFLIAGTGRHERKLRALADDLGVDDRVHFLGYVPDEELPTLYSSADVFVLPSRYEGFGLVLLEAMACGTPVIGTKVGGIPTVVHDGEDGYLVEPDVRALSEAFEKVSRDDAKVKTMSELALKNAKAHSWPRTITQTEKLYEHCLSADTEGGNANGL